MKRHQHKWPSHISSQELIEFLIERKAYNRVIANRKHQWGTYVMNGTGWWQFTECCTSWSLTRIGFSWTNSFEGRPYWNELHLQWEAYCAEKLAMHHLHQRRLAHKK